MSEAVNITPEATRVPDIIRGVGAVGGNDLQLANRYQFSSILKHLVDTPEKTLETAQGPEKNSEPLVRPKTVEDTRKAASDTGQDRAEHRNSPDTDTDRAAAAPERRDSSDDHPVREDNPSPEYNRDGAPTTDESAARNIAAPRAAPAEANQAPNVAAENAGLKLAQLADEPSGKLIETTPGQVTSKSVQNVLSSALTDKNFSKIGEDLHNAVQNRVKEVVEKPNPQSAGTALRSQQEQELSQKLGLAQALSVHVDKGIDSATRSAPLHTLAKGAHMAQLADPGTGESFVGGNGAKGNAGGENIQADRKASVNHANLPKDKAFGQNTAPDPTINFGQTVRAQASMTGMQQAAAAASMGAKAQPISLDLSNLNVAAGPNGPSQVSQLAKANPMTAARQPQRPPVPVEQVAINIQKAVGEGADRINIKLHPAQLGRVEIRMDIGKDGQLSAVILAEKPETLEMLQRDVRGLERALQDAGLRTDGNSLNFGLKSQNSQGTEPGRDRENSHSDQPSEHSDTPDGNRDGANHTHPGVYGQNLSRNGGIDIRV